VHPVRLTAAAAFVTLAACAGGHMQPATPTPENPDQVIIWEYKFVPQTLTVPVGTTVTWVNHDTAPHTATHRTYGAEAFDTGDLPNGATFQHTFRTPGSYPYLCMYHQGMTGTIVVQ
jgi:plastocyanin